MKSAKRGGGILPLTTTTITPPTPTLSLPLLLLLSLSPISPTLSLEAPAYHHKLQGWSQLMSDFRDPDKMADRQSYLQELRPLLDLTSSQWRDAIVSAITSSSWGGVGDDVMSDVSEEAMVMMMSEGNGTSPTAELCLNHTLAIVAGIAEGEYWAKQMLDAMGKPSFGIMDGNVNWPGGYTECHNVTANTTVTSHPYFSGQYCTLYSSPPVVAATMTPSLTLSLGLCVPDSCSSADLTLLAHMVTTALNVTSPKLNPVVVCEARRSINAKAVVAIIICSIIGCLMLVGTAVDIICLQRPKWSAAQLQEEVTASIDNGGHGHLGNASSNPEEELLLPKHGVKAGVSPPQLGVVGKVLVAFSVYTNGSKLLSTRQAPGSLNCVHGIRFLSMSWVVLGHTWATPASLGWNLVPYMHDILTKWTYQGIINATVSVDSFFVLSGLLVAYLTLKEMKKREGKLNWFLFYFHRFWRLTPAYMLCLMVYACLAPFWGKGPFWPAKFQDEDFCADNWWTNLLYINNFVKLKELCFAHTWYLANDMQFYILSPLIFVPLYFFPVVGLGVAGVFLLITSITPGVISQHYQLPPGLLQQVQGQTANSTAFMDYFDKYYVKPYNRMGTYIVGMLAGYFLYRSNCKLRIHWMTNTALWAVFTASALAVLYGLFETGNGHPATVPVAALYNAVSRQVWGACVAWVVIACVTGNGGFVNTILSWSGLVPLSRLTYCVYLLHLMVLELVVLNQQTVFFLNDINLVCLFLALMVAVFAVAFVGSLAFEAPMMGLERIFLRPAAAKQEHHKHDETALRRGQ